jgi:hypothetical protein
MRKQFLVAAGCIVSTVASAQERRAAADKWRSCADAAAVRYSKSTESAAAVVRSAALACPAEKGKLGKLSNRAKAPALQTIT